MANEIRPKEAALARKLQTRLETLEKDFKEWGNDKQITPNQSRAGAGPVQHTIRDFTILRESMNGSFAEGGDRAAALRYAGGLRGTFTDKVMNDNPNRWDEIEARLLAQADAHLAKAQGAVTLDQRAKYTALAAHFQRAPEDLFWQLWLIGQIMELLVDAFSLQ